MICTACTAEVPQEDHFCERCGEPVSPSGEERETCPCETGMGEVDDEGFCQRCGRRVQRPASDHVKEELSMVCAAVSDKGVRHQSNQDRFALAQKKQNGQGWAMVVCDGVSSTRRAEEAARSVASTVSQQLLRTLEQDEDAERAEMPAVAGEQSDAGAMRAAIDQATQVLESETGALRWSAGAPSTTVVAAMVRNRRLTVGWAGDSRAYWITKGSCLALTRDHSWLRDAVEAGETSREEGLQATQAHAITRWIGVDAGQRAEPEIEERELHGDGMLLLCTDGLWNHAETEEALAVVVGEASAGAESALVVAQRLVQFANEQGGHDNVTVAVLRLAEEPEPTLHEPAEVN